MHAKRLIFGFHPKRFAIVSFALERYWMIVTRIRIRTCTRSHTHTHTHKYTYIHIHIHRLHMHMHTHHNTPHHMRTHAHAHAHRSIREMIFPTGGWFTFNGHGTDISRIKDV